MEYIEFSPFLTLMDKPLTYSVLDFFKVQFAFALGLQLVLSVVMFASETLHICSVCDVAYDRPGSVLGVLVRKKMS